MWTWKTFRLVSIFLKIFRTFNLYTWLLSSFISYFWQYHPKVQKYHIHITQLSSVQFSHSVVSDSLWPHESQHARPPCPSPTPRVYLLMSIESVMPSSHLILCHPFSSCLQSLPASGSFPMNQFFASGGQSIGVSASASVLPMNTQDWSPLGWTGWLSLQSKGLSKVFSNTTVQKHQFSALNFLYSPTLTSVHDQWKNHSLD